MLNLLISSHYRSASSAEIEPLFIASMSRRAFTTYSPYLAPLENTIFVTHQFMPPLSATRLMLDDAEISPYLFDIYLSFLITELLSIFRKSIFRYGEAPLVNIAFQMLASMITHTDTSLLIIFDKRRCHASHIATRFALADYYKMIISIVLATFRHILGARARLHYLARLRRLDIRAGAYTNNMRNIARRGHIRSHSHATNTIELEASLGNIYTPMIIRISS